MVQKSNRGKIRSLLRLTNSENPWRSYYISCEFKSWKLRETVHTNVILILTHILQSTCTFRFASRYCNTHLWNYSTYWLDWKLHWSSLKHSNSLAFFRFTGIGLCLQKLECSQSLTLQWNEWTFSKSSLILRSTRSFPYQFFQDHFWPISSSHTCHTLAPTSLSSQRIQLLKPHFLYLASRSETVDPSPKIFFAYYFLFLFFSSTLF